MTRDPGQLVLPSNIERTIAAPLDAATVVNGLTALLHEDTFKSLIDDNDYSYVGLIVSVVNDPEPNNNGIYTLLQQPTTDISNWQKQQPIYDETLLTNSKHLITAVNEIYTSAITRHDEFDSEINYVSSILEDHIEDAKIKIDFVSANLVSASTILHNEILNTDNAFASNLDHVSSTLDNKIDIVSSNITNALVLTSNTLNTKLDDTNASLINSLQLSSNTLNTKINTTSSNIVNTLTLSTNTLTKQLELSSNTLDTKINITSANLTDALELSSKTLTNQLTVSSTTLYKNLTAATNNLTNSLKLTANTLNTKINTVSSNLVDVLKLSSNALDTKINTTSSNLANTITVSSNVLDTKINATNANVAALSANKQDNLVYYTEDTANNVVSVSSKQINYNSLSVIYDTFTTEYSIDSTKQIIDILLYNSDNICKISPFGDDAYACEIIKGGNIFTVNYVNNVLNITTSVSSRFNILIRYF